MNDSLLSIFTWMLLGKVAAFGAAIYCMACAGGRVLAWAIDLDDVMPDCDDAREQQRPALIHQHPPCWRHRPGAVDN